MKTNFKTMRNVFLFVLAALLIVSLATVGMMSASAQEEEPTVESIRFTSYAVIMDVDEEFTFSAEVMYSDGSTSNEVTWSSSNPDVLDIDDAGVAYAFEEGQARITATAGGVSAYVDVLVSSTTPRAESIEVFPKTLDMGIGWKTRIGYTILPADAYDMRVTWASSADSIVSVDDNGNIEALAAGSADITVTTFDQHVSATCKVTVSANLGEATLTPAKLTTMIGQVENNQFTVSVDLPDEATVSSYQWYAEDDGIASFDPNSDATGTVFSWNFGTTAIHVVVTDSLGNKYAANGSVLVTAEYYYITGLVEDLPDPTDDPWIEYETEDEARQAGVLLEQSEPGLFSITREFWANDTFQIIHNDMDVDWTTKITSTAFNEAGSSMAYIANTADMFAVNALGTYNVTLDLRDGRAQVTINMVSLQITSMDVSVSPTSLPYLQLVGTEPSPSMQLDVYTIPEAAEINLDNVRVIVPASAAQLVTATPRLNEGKLNILLTLNSAPTANTVFTLKVEIDNVKETADGETTVVNTVTDDIQITVLADGESYVKVSSIAFDSQLYIVNVNNGAKPWVSSDPIKAAVNADASVQDIVYSEDSDEIYIEYIDGEPYVHAAALGTYTIYATSLADPEMVAESKVLVTSVDGFYLIGVLDGVEVNNWASLKPEVTSLTGTPYEDWQLSAVEGDNGIYTANVHLMQYDRFSIAFLGMNGNWDGIINNQYFNWDESTGNFYENGINIEITISGTYNVTLDLTGSRPSFTVDLDTPDNPEVIYNLYLYIVRSGDAWNADLSDEGNVIAYVGYIPMLDGVAQGEFVYNADSAVVYDFYNFYATTGEWPTIQFVTARGNNDEERGIIGGAFQQPTWYGSAYEGIDFSGTAYYKAPDEPVEGEETKYNYFTNYRNFSELYWVGDANNEIPESMAGQMTVSFTFTFDKNGVLTAVKLDFVSTSAFAE